MAGRSRAWWLAGHAACATLALATWRVGSAPAVAQAAPPESRWVVVSRGQDRLLVRDLGSGQTLAAPNPLPRLSPLVLAPGFNPNFWAIADTHRVKVISIETGEAVVNFAAPTSGVERLVWLDEDRVAVVPHSGSTYVVHRVSTGCQTRR